MGSDGWSLICMVGQDHKEKASCVHCVFVRMVAHGHWAVRVWFSRLPMGISTNARCMYLGRLWSMLLVGYGAKCLQGSQ